MSKKAAAAGVAGDRRLKIQVGVCKRLVKEVAYYAAEVLTNEARVQKMRDDGKDIYDIRKQEEVLGESYMMIPDSKARCETSIAELTSLLDELADDADISAALVKEAREIIAQQEEA